MNIDLVSATFGGCLILFGALMQMSHRAAWQRQQTEVANDPRELRHYHARFHRRSRTSGLIAFVGLLIPVADLPFVWNRGGPVVSAIVWVSVFALCVWIGLLAVGDFATTRAHTQANLARLQLQKKELVSQFEAIADAKTETKSCDSPHG